MGNSFGFLETAKQIAPYLCDMGHRGDRGSLEIGIHWYSHPQIRDRPIRYVGRAHWARIPGLSRLVTDSVALGHRLDSRGNGLALTTFSLALLCRRSSSRSLGTS